MSSYIWFPTTDYVDNANVSRLAHKHGLRDITELRERSVADPAWYWNAVLDDLGITFPTPHTKVLDITRGIEHPDWFVGAELNIVDLCLRRWRDAGADRVAVRHEAEDGSRRNLTFGELADSVASAAAGLRRLGIGRGDAVGLYVPMIPEAVVAVYAVAAIGAVLVPLFSGFAAAAIGARLRDADVKAVVAADGTVRRGRTVAMLPQLTAALADCPTVEHLVVVDNVGAATDVESTVTVTQWSDLTADPADLLTERVPAMHPLMLGYTSGTTGRPKGAVHTHAGFLVKTASEIAYSFDMTSASAFCWITDMGWIMGPLSIVGTHANGATLVLYEGSRTFPTTIGCGILLSDMVSRCSASRRH